MASYRFCGFRSNSIMLDHNQLQSLPECIGELDWRTSQLELGYNQLSSLPMSFTDLQIYFVRLSNNQLTTLPFDFWTMHAGSFDLSNNLLTTLPSFGAESARITELYELLTARPTIKVPARVNVSRSATDS